MDIAAEIDRVEKRVTAAGVTMAKFLRGLDMPSSTWARWKAGERVPLVTTWDRVEVAARALKPKRKK